MDVSAKAPKKKKALAFLKTNAKPSQNTQDDPFGRRADDGQKDGGDDEDSLSLFKRSKEFFPIVLQEQERSPRDATPEARIDAGHATGDDDGEPSSGSVRSSKRQRLSSPRSGLPAVSLESYSELYGPATPPPPASRSSTPPSILSSGKHTTPLPRKGTKEPSPGSGGSEVRARGRQTGSNILPTPSPSRAHQPSSATDVVAIDDGDDPFEDAARRVNATSAQQTRRRASSSAAEDNMPDVIDIVDSEDDLTKADTEAPEDELAYFITRAAKMEAAAKAATAALIPSDEESTGDADSQSTGKKPGRRSKHDAVIPIKIFVLSRLDSEVLQQRTFGVKRGLNQDLSAVRRGFVQWAMNLGVNVSEDMERDMFLTWKGRRIYDSATGVSLGWQPTAAGEFSDRGPGFNRGGVLLEAWTTDAFLRHKEEEERQQLIDRGELTDGAAEGGDDAAGASAEEQEPEVQRVRLMLQEKNSEPLKLTVYIDMAIKILIGAYRKQRKVPDDREIRLQFDGDWLEPNVTVGEADIEDMCTIEVYVK